MRKKINVLWTGGLDSSFRIYQLSLSHVEIQPYYIVEERCSEKYERRSISRITEYIRKSPKTKAKLNDTIYVDWHSFSQEQAIKHAWNILREKYRIGSQYEYLANFAKDNNLILEVGLEKSPRSKAYNALISEGEFKIEAFNEIKRYAVREDKSSKELNEIFGRLRFPKELFEISKLEEVEQLKAWGGVS